MGRLMPLLTLLRIAAYGSFKKNTFVKICPTQVYYLIINLKMCTAGGGPVFLLSKAKNRTKFSEKCKFYNSECA